MTRYSLIWTHHNIMYKSTHEISFVLSRGSDESPPLLWCRQTSVRPAMRFHTVKSYKQLTDWFQAQLTKWQVQISRTKITKCDHPPSVAIKLIFIGLNIGQNFVIYVNRPLVYPDSCYLVVEVLFDRLHGRTFLDNDTSRTLHNLLDDGERWDDRRSDVEPHTLLTANICQS